MQEKVKVALSKFVLVSLSPVYLLFLARHSRWLVARVYESCKLYRRELGVYRRCHPFYKAETWREKELLHQRTAKEVL